MVWTDYPVRASATLCNIDTAFHIACPSLLCRPVFGGFAYAIVLKSWARKMSSSPCCSLSASTLRRGADRSWSQETGRLPTLSSRRGLCGTFSACPGDSLLCLDASHLNPLNLKRRADGMT